jgi:hypothetical protein
MAQDLPTVEFLNKLLRCEPESGKLFWKERSAGMYVGSKSPARKAEIFNRRYAGSEAFTSDTQGYKMGQISGRNIGAHRVIWAMVNGKWPENFIDHINRDRSDNRICNLREVTPQQNMYNLGLSPRNTSGYKGVSWYKYGRKWAARIRTKEGPLQLGYFDKIEDAAAAYAKAAKKYHGEHSGLEGR